MHTTLQVTKCSCQHLSSDSNSCQTMTDDRPTTDSFTLLVLRGGSVWLWCIYVSRRMLYRSDRIKESDSENEYWNQCTLIPYNSLPFHTFNMMLPIPYIYIHLHSFASITSNIPDSISPNIQYFHAQTNMTSDVWCDKLEVKQGFWSNLI